MTEPLFPERLVVEPTTRCNLACPGCVKHTQGWAHGDGHLDPAAFAALEPVVARCSRLVFSGIGEPLLHPHLVDLVALARRWNPQVRIGLQSNGMLVTPALARELVAAGLDEVAFSVDAVDDRLLSRLRPGATVEGIARALALVAEASRALGRAVRLGVEVVLAAATVDHLPVVIDWSGAHGARFAILSHRIPYAPADAAETLLSFVSQRALDFARAALAELLAQGLDVRRLDQAYYHPFPGPQERRIKAAVQAMLAAARQAGVEVPLGRAVRALAPEAEARRRRLAASLAQAQAAAQAWGMELALPAEAVLEPGACPFVATPTLMLAQDGALSPCHLLWHDALVHPEGQPVRVRRRILGRLPEDDPVAVWRSPAAQGFRQQAQGGFARCFDCNVLPCNFVDGHVEPFAADCYGAAVPCGICPWVGGGCACLG